MNVLPLVFSLTLSNDIASHISDICVHRNYDRMCYEHKQREEENPEARPEGPEPPGPGFSVELYHYKGLQLVIGLILWMFYSRIEKFRRGNREGPFYTILFILSLTVSFRILFSIVAISISAFFRDTSYSTIKFLLQSSLYVDYCSNFFSLTITFFMSLNRCFCFVAKDWNSKIFDGFHVVFPIAFSALVSISGAVTCITTSEIRRVFVDRIGFVDVGPNKGFRVMINRTVFLFPVGSIICYIILYYHLKQRSKMVLNKTNQSKGEQKVFVQLFITTLLYVTIHLTYEGLVLINWREDFSAQMFFISTLGIFNCLPEISLPLLLICSNFQVKKKIFSLVSTRSNGDRSVQTVTAKPSVTAGGHADN